MAESWFERRTVLVAFWGQYSARKTAIPICPPRNILRTAPIYVIKLRLSSHILRRHPDSNKNNPANTWSPASYVDFTPRFLSTCRSDFLQPIKDLKLSSLLESDGNYPSTGPSRDMHLSPQVKKWLWTLTRKKAGTSDTKWGCILRTGQSLLATVLLHDHLRRGKDLFLPLFSDSNPCYRLAQAYTPYLHRRFHFLCPTSYLVLEILEHPVASFQCPPHGSHWKRVWDRRQTMVRTWHYC